MHTSAARDMVFLLNEIAFYTKDFVRSYVQRVQFPDVILTVRCLLELLYVRHGYSSLNVLSVMSLCMLFVSCQLVRCALFLCTVPCVRFSIINNNVLTFILNYTCT